MGIRNLDAVGLGQDRGGVHAAIGRAAERTGVDFGYLLAQAKSESGLNPNARSGSSTATGLYQFIDQSWLGIVKLHGAKHGMGWAANAITRSPGGRWNVAPEARQAVFALREQAGPAAMMAAEYAATNQAQLSDELGRQPTSTDLYFAHFLGVDGAARFLKAADASPDASAAALFPREARANRSIFYTRSGEARSMDAVYQLMGRKLGDDAGTIGPPAIDAASPQLAYANEIFNAETAETVEAPELNHLLGGLASFDPLRPNPTQAKLAYLMLASDDAVTGGNGDLQA